MLKILLVHNTLAPYRLPLFDYMISKSNMKVYLIEKGLGHRKWGKEVANTDLKIFHTNNKYFNFFGKKIIYEIKIADIKDYDLVIVPDDKAYLIVLRLIKDLDKNQMLVSWTANNRYSLFHNNKILNILIKLIFNKLRKIFYIKKPTYFGAMESFSRLSNKRI